VPRIYTNKPLFHNCRMRIRVAGWLVESAAFADNAAALLESNPTTGQLSIEH